MGNRYHVNPETGSAGKCKAKSFCPFGSMEDDHYDSMAEARKAFEKKNESFNKLGPEAKVKLLSRKVIRKEDIDYDYIGRSLEYIQTWESSWTPDEEANFDKVMELNRFLQKTPFTEKDREKAQQMIDSLTPPPVRKRSYGLSGMDDSWRARDKNIIDLANYLLVRKLGDSLTPKPADPVTNDRLIGLEKAQEEALSRFNHFSSRPYVGAVEPYLQESIARSVRGDEIPDFADDSEHRTLLPVRERLLFTLNPKSPGYDQSLYLATVFPVKELKEEMEKADVDNVTVSVLNNGREHGNIYSVLQPDGTVRAFTVYEHRNSDSIIINGKEGWDGKDLPYAGESKEEFYAEFAVKDNRQAARALVFFMKQAQRGELESDQELVRKSPKLDWKTILSKKIPGFREWAEKQGEVFLDPEKETEEDIIKRLDF